MKCLVFRLYGPLASWGSTAVGGVRSTRTMPSRSAIIGLVAASLGIRRTELEALTQLNESLGLAVKCESSGHLLRDYHTAQVPGSEKKALWVHRKAELENGQKGLNTILSTRDYRVDGHWLVGLVIRRDSDHTLESIRNSLIEPVFPLFLGRKSCPLAVPVHPVLFENVTVLNAFSEYRFPLSFRRQIDSMLRDDSTLMEWDSDISVGVEFQEVTDVWDNPASRERWQFGRRTVHSARLERSE